jgi:hypothetical protein
MMMNPKFDPKFLYEVNRAIDQPSELDIVLSKKVGNKFNVPGLWKGGHRQYNHDMLTGMIKGMQMGGYEGMRAVFLHYMGDAIADSMNRSMGTDFKDALESMMLGANKVPRYDFEK